MIFDQMTGALYADDGAFLKTVHCPLALRPEQLLQSTNGDPSRFCNSCKKTVRCIDDLADSEVQTAVSDDESLCLFSTPTAKNVVFLQSIGTTQKNYKGLPVVQTMRSLEAMADAQARGFDLVFKSTSEDSAFGEDKYLVYQKKSTGELWWTGDFRTPRPAFEGLDGSNRDDWEMVRNWFFVRPDRPFPLAAYAIPKELHVGARIFLEDVIEDVLETVWNQGNSTRLISTAATWNGVDFDIDEPMDSCFVG